MAYGTSRQISPVQHDVAFLTNHDLPDLEPPIIREVDHDTPRCGLTENVRRLTRHERINADRGPHVPGRQRAAIIVHSLGKAVTREAQLMNRPRIFALVFVPMVDGLIT